MSKRILITGSRNWTDRTAILAAILKEAADDFTTCDKVTIIHGGARGADTIAGEIARQFGFTEEVHPANWEKFGKSAGCRRNEEMVVRGADVCLAFPTESSRGTWDCVRRAKKAGIEVKIIRPCVQTGKAN